MTKNKIYIALVLSLLLHLSQYIVIQRIPNPIHWSHPDELIEFYPIETTEVDKRNSTKPIVTQPDKNTPAIDNDKPADFFSEEKRRYEKQTRVEKLGVNNNSGSTEKNNKPQQKNDSFDPNGLEFNQALRNTQRSNSTSQYQHQLPNDIAMGDVTNLNTDAHIYASFYNRIAEAFYIRWVQNLEKTWNRLSLDTKQKLSGLVWRTELEIILNARGEVQKVLTMKPSGFPLFDQDAVRAFYEAQFFPNPPKAKVEADGTIRLKYRISVHVR